MSNHNNRISMLQAKTVLLLLAITWNFAQATRHSFTTGKNSHNTVDNRAFIGPIGTPFGFLSGGVYELTVLQHDLKLLVDQQSVSVLDQNVQAGFGLMKFGTEAEFGTFEERIFEMGNAEVGLDGNVSEPSYDGKVTRPITKSMCPLDGAKSANIFILPLAEADDGQPLQMRHEIKDGERGLYFLFYAVCYTSDKEHGKNSNVKLKSSFKLDLSMHNIDRYGRVNYLAAGDIPLPMMYLIYALIYAKISYLWYSHLKKCRSGSTQTSHSPTASVYQIHYLMAILCILKTISLFSESARMHYIRINGSAVMWTTIYYTFEFIKAAMLFTVILLLGSGWSMFKPFLNGKEKKLLFFVLLLQMVNNIAEIVVLHHMTGEVLYNKWAALIHLFDVVCCGLVLIPIVWQIGTLEERVGESPQAEDVESIDNEHMTMTKDGNESAALTPDERKRILSKLKLFRSFYIIVIAYIYFTRIIIYLFSSSLGFHQTWLRFMVLEFGTLIFYIYTGYTFRPVVEHSYEEIEQAGLMNNDEVIRETDSRVVSNNVSSSSRSTLTRKQREPEVADI